MSCDAPWRGVWRALVLAVVGHGILVAGWWYWHGTMDRSPKAPEMRFDMVTLADPVPVVPDAPAPPLPPPPEPVAAPPPEPEPAVAPIKPLPPKPPRPPKVRRETRERPGQEQPVRAVTQLPAPVAAAPAAPSAPAVVEEPFIPPDVRAAYASNPKPVYPPAARRMGYQGTVLLVVAVLASGAVERVELRQGSGFDSLDRAALEAVAGWRFVPARRGGQAVAATVTVPIRFQLQAE
ncbi:MAG: energy transducer TonB [Magnetococcales bacterium]|nr:energy transducer TonB [Magnetococcales bacterium]